MWFYLEFALIIFGFFYAYRAGWKSGWNTAIAVIRSTVNEAQRLQKIQDLNPKRKMETSPLSEEEKHPLDQ